MIVLFDPSDEKIAVELQQRLRQSAGARFSTEISSLDSISMHLTDSNSSSPLFVTGHAAERMALAIVYLRSLTAGPVIAVSRGANVRQIVQLMGVGASDILDLNTDFASQLHAIFEKPNDYSLRLPAQGKSEQHIALLLLGAWSEGEIAGMLGLSCFTIHNHVKQIYRKCNVHSRVQFIREYCKSSHSGLTLPSPRATSLT